MPNIKANLLTVFFFKIDKRGAETLEFAQKLTTSLQQQIAVMNCSDRIREVEGEVNFHIEDKENPSKENPLMAVTTSLMSFEARDKSTLEFIGMAGEIARKSTLKLIEHLNVKGVVVSSSRSVVKEAEPEEGAELPQALREILNKLAN